MINPPERADIPDDAMINGEITITSYFDSDGRLKYATHVSDEMNLAQAVGLCELAKISIHQSYLMMEPYEPDDPDEDEEDDEE